MSLRERWHAPTPKQWKRVIRIALTLSAGAVGGLLINPVLGAIIPGFHYTLITWVEILFKNVAAAGVVVAAIAKFQKENPNTDDKQP